MSIVGCAIIVIVIAFFLLRERKRKNSTLVSRNSISLETRFQIKDIQIQNRLGGGNFGEVYRGLWKSITPVALKKLKDEEQLKEFEKEAEILKLKKSNIVFLLFFYRSLAHRNIVQFFGIYNTGTEQYMVTEFMSKGSLLELLRSEGPENITMIDLLAM